MTVHSLQKPKIWFFNQRLFLEPLNNKTQETISDVLNSFVSTLPSVYKDDLNGNGQLSINFSKDLSRAEFKFAKEKEVSFKIEEFTHKKGFFKKIETPAFVLFKLIKKVVKAQERHAEINIEALKEFKTSEKKVSKIKRVQKFFTSRISASVGTIGKVTGLVAGLLGYEATATDLIEVTDQPSYMISYAMAEKTHRSVDNMRKDLGMLGKMERLKSIRYWFILSVGLLISTALILIMFPSIHALVVSAFGVYALNIFLMVSGIYSVITSLMGITFQTYMLYKVNRFAKKLKAQQAIDLKEKTAKNYQQFLQTIQDKLILSDQKRKTLMGKTELSEDSVQALLMSKQRKKLYKFKTVTSSNTVDFILRYIRDLTGVDCENITDKNIETLNHFYREKLEGLIDKRLKTNKLQNIARLEGKIKKVNATLEFLSKIEMKLKDQNLSTNKTKKSVVTNSEIEALEKIYKQTVHLVTKRVYKNNHARIVNNRGMVVLYTCSLAVASLGFVGELFHAMQLLPGAITHFFTSKIDLTNLSEVGLFRKIGAIFRPAIYLTLDNAEIADPLKRGFYKRFEKREVDSYCPA